jgi:hypothetical protein
MQSSVTQRDCDRAVLHAAWVASVESVKARRRTWLPNWQLELTHAAHSVQSDAAHGSVAAADAATTENNKARRAAFLRAGAMAEGMGKACKQRDGTDEGW